MSGAPRRAVRIGLISDTHGLLRPHRPWRRHRQSRDSRAPGRRRFSLPIAAGEPLIEDGQVEVRLATLVT
jgi:hypothetical protein